MELKRIGKTDSLHKTPEKTVDFPDVTSPYTGKPLDLDIRIYCASCGKVISYSNWKLPVAKECKCGNTTFQIKYTATEHVRLKQ
jgi:hypothetical protein